MKLSDMIVVIEIVYTPVVKEHVEVLEVIQGILIQEGSEGN